ncbi:hypothetical protein GHI93_04575 [Lactococcus hircilactis]|uniref:Uncharacterized protein n=1 Tax=Lactococcus hircilactis TaxID=1494462 RepID=A0A7X1Z8F5_9LACT|nr:hypothetical protein [Lactococcus hircilactis]MQW39214.1 hypothetical protein [Lactococcus hircilactis]
MTEKPNYQLIHDGLVELAKLFDNPDSAGGIMQEIEPDADLTLDFDGLAVQGFQK